MAHRQETQTDGIKKIRDEYDKAHGVIIEYSLSQLFQNPLAPLLDYAKWLESRLATVEAERDDFKQRLDRIADSVAEAKELYVAEKNELLDKISTAEAQAREFAEIRVKENIKPVFNSCVCGECDGNGYACWECLCWGKHDAILKHKPDCITGKSQACLTQHKEKEK